MLQPAGASPLQQLDGFTQQSGAPIAAFHDPAGGQRGSDRAGGAPAARVGQLSFCPLARRVGLAQRGERSGPLAGRGNDKVAPKSPVLQPAGQLEQVVHALARSRLR